MADSSSEKEKLLGGQSSKEKHQHRDKSESSHDSSDDCSHIKRKTSKNEPVREFSSVGDMGCRTCLDTKSRVNNICEGAANIMSGNIKYAFVISSMIILFLFLSAVLLLISTYVEDNILSNGLHKRNALCKEITAENYSTFLRGTLDAATHKVEKFVDPKRNIFYVIDRPLAKEQACNVESVLRLLSDKLIYIIEMDNKNLYKNCEDIDYITFLQKFYANLNRLKTNKRHFFEGSLFENCWDNSDDALSTFAAKVLAIWQFGGMALSENLLMNSRNIFDKPVDKCMADKDLIYCPHECSAYTYDLMREIVNKMKSNSSTNKGDFETLIDDSISEICSDNAEQTGCNQVYKLQKDDMCDGKSGGMCQFIRTDKLRKLSRYRETLKQFCHYIGHILN